jgi:hypothetical protein
MDPDASVLPAATRQIVVYPQGSYYVTVTAATPTTTTPTPTTLITTSQPTANQTPAATTLPPAATVNITPPAAAETTQAGPEVSGSGTLSVATEPSGAQVFVDNIPRGTTPATIKGLPAGSHTLRFEHTGYQNMTVPVIINSGGTTEYAAKLMQEPGGGIAVVPVLALAAIVLGIAGAGIYLYLRHRAQQ